LCIETTYIGALSNKALEMKKLNYGQEQELKYFKQQEAKWSEERYKNDHDKNAWNNYELAKTELKLFVSKLRKEGYNI
jgi:hypothetical protein